jgi:hypothetical protein
MFHTGFGRRHKTEVDDKRNGGEERGESSEEERVDFETALLAECRGGCADHREEGKAA